VLMLNIGQRPLGRFARDGATVDVLCGGRLGPGPPMGATPRSCGGSSGGLGA